MSDRGVSENIGFVLVFAIVVSTIGIVYATGFSGLLDARNAEQINNMERAFEVVEDNMQDVSTGNVPSRATELKLSSGSLYLGERTTITIQTNSSLNRACNATRPTTIKTRPLIYEDGDSAVVYASGAIFRTDGGNSVMLDSPGWLSDSARAVFPIITIISGDSTSVGGQTTVLVVARETSDQNTFRCNFDNQSTTIGVNVTVESTRAEAWERYFEDQGYHINQSADGVVSAEFNTTKLYVPETVVEIDFE